MNENLRNLKTNDNDKYLASIFAPADKRDALLALFNFHYEISQIPLEVSETMVGMIKFQWWRDCIEEIKQGKPPRPHPVLKDLKGVNYDKLITVIDNYEKLLENWQPKTFAELEEFIANTQYIIFQQAANILETAYSEDTAKAYSYSFMARKIRSNSKSYKFATEPDNMAQKLESAIPTSGRHKTVFDIIAHHKGSRWKLLLKLIFAKAVL